MIDSHCHFDFPPFDTEPERWLKQAKLGQAYDSVSYALGMHPVWISEHLDDHLQLLEQHLAARTSSCVAVGECGLDFSMAVPEIGRQTALLHGQLELASKFNLPVILHCRKAHNELLAVLNDFPGVAGVLHAFSGSYEMGMQYIRRGFYLGVGGTITYPRANKTRQAVAKLPLGNLLLETDARDMPMVGQQGKANSPEYLMRVASELSLLKECGVKEVIQATSRNADRLFALNVVT